MDNRINGVEERSGKNKDFVVHLNEGEYQRIDAVVKDNVLSRAEFIRFSAELLEKRMQVVYPAIFRKEEGVYTVSFFDLPINTFGDTLEEAFFMAGDALYCYLSGLSDPWPRASDIEGLRAEKGTTILWVKPWFYRCEGAKQFILERGSRN